MKPNIAFLGLVALAAFGSIAPTGCAQKQETQADSPTSTPKEQAPKDFNGYWYGGKAELTSYALNQARYGELNSGEAVLVFVTEPFSRSKQVKLDDGPAAGADAVPVMKLNLEKKFLTGIYPYSLLMSTFTPANRDTLQDALKVTTTVQEWCGHAFMQVNNRADSLHVQSFSYFESEGDRAYRLPKVLIEDELWTWIRLNPSLLPTGEKTLLPSVFYQRLRHTDGQPRKANLSLSKVVNPEFGTDSLMKYSIVYAEPDRELHIYFHAQFPYEIEGWEEIYLSGWPGTAPGENRLTTRAKKMATLRTDYWIHHFNVDRAMRKDLGLSVE